MSNSLDTRSVTRRLREIGDLIAEDTHIDYGEEGRELCSIAERMQEDLAFRHEPENLPLSSERILARIDLFTQEIVNFESAHSTLELAQTIQALSAAYVSLVEFGQ